MKSVMEILEDRLEFYLKRSKEAKKLPVDKDQAPADWDSIITDYQRAIEKERNKKETF
jgi:hypothetical protein